VVGTVDVKQKRPWGHVRNRHPNFAFFSSSAMHRLDGQRTPLISDGICLYNETRPDTTPVQNKKVELLNKYKMLKIEIPPFPLNEKKYIPGRGTVNFPVKSQNPWRIPHSIAPNRT
jgi:hypothetical protein